jgi:DNA-binding LytR/AlgR family response regulator
MHSTVIPTDYYTYLHHLPFGWEMVQYMASERNYTRFTLVHKPTHLTCKSLCIYVSHLPAYMIRVHKSYAVNLRFVKAIDHCNKSLLMKDGSRIPVARRRWGMVNTAIENGKSSIFFFKHKP